MYVCVEESIFVFEFNLSSSAMKLSGSIDASEQKKTKTKLKKFLTRRPTLQAVREKGYIKGKLTLFMQIAF